MFAMISHTIHWAAHTLFWIAFALFFIGMFKRNQGYAKLCSDGRVRFVPRWWFVSAWSYLLVRLGFVGAEYLRTGSKEPLQFSTGILILVAVVVALLSLPGMLLVTDDALEERNWVWRNKKILWSEIQEIQTEKKGSAITVIGPNHSRIVYTNLYPDRSRFLLEIERHCGENLPSNFPRTPLNSGTAI